METLFGVRYSASALRLSKGARRLRLRLHLSRGGSQLGQKMKRYDWLRAVSQNCRSRKLCRLHLHLQKLIEYPYSNHHTGSGTYGVHACITGRSFIISSSQSVVHQLHLMLLLLLLRPLVSLRNKLIIMASRRKSGSSDGENPTKRQRVGPAAPSVAEPAPTPTACFRSLNNDCLVHILSFLETEEMNDATLINKSICEARSNESLDQTRTGTIVCTENTTTHSINNAARNGRWDQVFSGHRTRAKIVGMEKATGHFGFAYPLNGVTSLVVMAGARELDVNSFLYFLGGMLPNVTDIDFSRMNLSSLSSFSVRRICWNPRTTLTLTGGSNLHLASLTVPALVGSTYITKLYMDSFTFSSDQTVAEMLDGANTRYYILNGFPNLERLSIKGASWFDPANRTETGPITQNMLIKVARQHPTLMWLRSDLTAENVAMLEQERPHITFVSD